MQIQWEPAKGATRVRSAGASRQDRRPDELILDSVRRIVRTLRMTSHAVEKALGLSGAQLFVLQKLGEDHALSINELAERTLTHQSSVSAVVSRLINQKLVKRSRSTTDGRKMDVTLTQAGRRLLDQAPKMPQERLLHGIQKLSRIEQKQLAALLSAMLRFAGLDEEPASLFFEDDRNGAARSRRRKRGQP